MASNLVLDRSFLFKPTNYQAYGFPELISTLPLCVEETQFSAGPLIDPLIWMPADARGCETWYITRFKKKMKEHRPYFFQSQLANSPL